MIISRSAFHSIFGPAEVPPGQVSPYVNPRDLGVILAMARFFRPRTVIEFGVQTGRTAELLIAETGSVTDYVGIDLPPGALPDLPAQEEEIPLEPGQFAQRFSCFRLLLRKSRELAPADLPPADLVFIDGSHAEADVAHDSELAHALIRRPGVILWHDYTSMPGVRAVVDRLNTVGGDRIVLVEGTWTCFEICEPRDDAPPTAPSAPRRKVTGR